MLHTIETDTADAAGYALLTGSPIGPLTLTGDGRAVTGLFFGDSAGGRSACPLLERAAEELREYFAGSRRRFDLPLSPAGTEFQRLVWGALLTIPYGQTVSYGQLARQIGRPSACRAVGMANHRNPISILIPCHRVVGSGGGLTGYGGGLERKQFLLELEKAHL